MESINVCLDQLEKFVKEYPYSINVADDKEYYYYENIITNMGIDNSKWSRLATSFDKYDYYLTVPTVKYGFKEEKDLLYFKMAVPEK